MTKKPNLQASNKENNTKQNINSTNPVMHSKVEDGFALLIGTFLVGFALFLLQSSNTLTGGNAGLALLVHYITGINFGLLFFVFNIPFYFLGYFQLGKQMVIKTFIAVALLSLMTQIPPKYIDISTINPIFGTIVANVIFGVGFLILFRHRASLGGFNLLALFFQEKLGIAAGKVQMMLDVCVLIASFAFVDWRLLLISIMGVIILNLILTMNHRQDRYVATS